MTNIGTDPTHDDPGELVDHMEQQSARDPMRPEGLRPNYWRDWAIGLLAVGVLMLIVAETDTALPVGMITLAFAAGVGSIAIGRRVVRSATRYKRQSAGRAQ